MRISFIQHRQTAFKLGVSLFCAILFPVEGLFGQSYALTPLAPSGYGYESRPSAMNNSAQVTGAFRPLSGAWHAFLFNGEFVDLGTLGGHQSEGLAINSAGDVVGTSDLVSGGPQHAFLYHSGQLIDLNSRISPATSWILASASYIGDAGQIVATTGSGSASRVFLLSPAGCGATIAAQVGSGAGSVVSCYTLSPWAGMLPVSGRPNGAAAGVKSGLPASSQPAASSSAGPVSVGFNSAGAAIGYSNVDANDSHAVLIANGSVTDLNSQVRQDSGWTLTRAAAINDFGQVAGVGTYQGQTEGFLLTPLNLGSSAANGAGANSASIVQQGTPKETPALSGVSAQNPLLPICGLSAQLIYNAGGNCAAATGITTPDGVNLLTGSLAVNGQLDTQVAGTQLTISGHASIANNFGLLFDVPSSCGTGCAAGPFSVYSNSQVFNGTTDNVFDIGYNIVPGSNYPATIPVNKSEAYYKWNWESNYNEYNNGTNTFEWNSNYWNAGGTMYVRPHLLSVDRTTLAVNWLFNGTVTLPGQINLTGTPLLSNRTPLQSLNAAGNNNVPLIQLGADNHVHLGPYGTPTYFDGPAALSNGLPLYSLNTSGALNSLIYQDAGNNVQIAASGQPTYFGGPVFLSGASINLNNNQNLTSYNASGTTINSLLYQDTSNNVRIAASGQPTYLGGLFVNLNNNENLTSWNAAGTARNSLIYEDTSNNVQIAASAQPVYLDGPVFLNGVFANLNNNENLTSWNAAGTARESLLYQDTSNNVRIAASGRPVYLGGPVHLLNLNNNVSLGSYNAAGTTVDSLIYQDTSNNVQIAKSGQPVFLDGPVFLNGSTVNLNNNENLTSWNAAGTARQSLIYQDASNNVQIAQSGQPVYLGGASVNLNNGENLTSWNAAGTTRQSLIYQDPSNKVQIAQSGQPLVFANGAAGVSSTGVYSETLYTPASSTAACTTGMFADDANYHYVCVAANVWKRVALSSF